MAKLQDIINVIAKDSVSRFYRPKIDIFATSITPTNEYITWKNFYEQKIKEPIPIKDIIAEVRSKWRFTGDEEKDEQRKRLAELELQNRKENALNIIKDLMSKYTLSKKQIDNLYKLLTSPKELTTIGYEISIKKGLTGSKKEKTPIMKRLYPGPKAMEKFLPEIISPSAEISQPILSKLAEQVAERTSKLKIPTEIKELILPWTTGYKGETELEKTLKSLEKVKTEREKTVEQIKDFINQLASKDVATTISAYIQIPFFKEVGQLISNLSGGFYNMEDYYRSINELASKSSEFVSSLNSVLSELLATQDALLKELGGIIYG